MSSEKSSLRKEKNIFLILVLRKSAFPQDDRVNELDFIPSP
jgi:hypothetical protein